MPKRVNAGKSVLKWRIEDFEKRNSIRSNKAITSRLGKIIWVEEVGWSEPISAGKNIAEDFEE